MKIIKLSAIDSTNSFLKEMAVNSVIEDFTTVVTQQQTKGRGQMNSEWVSEVGKNLTFSVFVRFESFLFSDQRYLSFAVALSVFEAVKSLELNRLSIKWPNDIMAGNKKIGGILIENSLKKDTIVSSIIGIGLNVNQDNFSKELSKASSLKKILGEEVGLDILLMNVLNRLKENIRLLKQKRYKVLEDKYLDNLYKKDIASMFKTPEGNLFMGKIIGVSQEGKLQLELEDETIKEFDLKEVSFI
ncbi:biotin--[acetyl-CoA-carboxylase] ligase [uncultured Tenacibaculum sp.]|uniref:biotin--[acetyl-CoA-carboxylase] ligase n=1 Tax=uncultured Tenacibaculum sp. TaxID=174713 RepID=UPI00260DAEEB|nr:biotin--[acetyl-CoA-carboxylase] ligase [uncultured Tenacibaculum sp.]